MVNPADLQSVFNQTVTENGERVRLKTYLQTFSGATYDDGYITKSGNDTWFDGLKQPLSSKDGGEDFKFLQQGLIQMDDSKLYIPGSVDITSSFKYKLYIGGSPALTPVYEIVPNGVINWSISGTDVYKKVFVRLLENGSFANEY